MYSTDMLWKGVRGTLCDALLPLKATQGKLRSLVTSMCKEDPPNVPHVLMIIAFLRILCVILQTNTIKTNSDGMRYYARYPYISLTGC